MSIDVKRWRFVFEPALIVRKKNAGHRPYEFQVHMFINRFHRFSDFRINAY